jgi:zinc transport system substrate-binding protein
VKLLPVDPVVDGVVGETDGEVLDGNVDPHVWVEPGRFIEMVTVTAKAMQGADPDAAATFAANAQTYLAELRALDAEFTTGLAQCESKALVTSHRAFGYLTNRYGLKQLPIAGISPDEEPDPKSLEAVAKAAKAEGVKVIFFESLVPKKLADTVAKEIGATTDALNPIEGLTAEELAAGESYASIQRTNLGALRKGLRCT